LGHTLEEVLLSKYTTLEPWFRVCISKEPYQSVMDTWQPLAKSRFKPELREFLTTKNLDYKRLLQ
jgi:hypothetical protein